MAAQSIPAPVSTPNGSAPNVNTPASTPPADFDSMFDQASTGEKNGVNEAALAKYPEGVRTTARGLANYQVTTSPFALTKPYWQQAMQAAQEYDPTFNASQYAIRQKLQNDFTSGKAADNIRSLNTTMSHLAALKKSADSLNNASIVPWNAVVNTVENTFGDARMNNYQTNADAVANELTKVFRGTNGAEADIKGWRERLSPNGSPDQQNGAIDKAIELMAGRMAALRDQYTSAMGRPPRQTFMSERAKGILQGMGYDPDNFEKGIVESKKTQPQRQSQPNSGGNPNPNGYVAGHVYGGLTYLGGDPNSQTSWRK